MAKSADAFRTISEASAELGVPQHVLRFWETKFTFVRPMKRAGGRRFYRPQDIERLRGIKVLLHDLAFTIKDVQRLHREEGLRGLIAAADGDVLAARLGDETPRDDRDAGVSDDADGPVLSPQTRARLSSVLGDLEAVKARIDGMIGPGAQA